MANSGSFVKGEKRPNQGKRGPNKATLEFRQVVHKLLEDNAGNFQRWLTQVAEGDGEAKPNPGKALDIIAGLAEYVAPKLARTEVTGADGGAIEVENTLDVSNLPTEVLTAIMAAKDASKPE
jgi:hypothetical protein